MKAHDVAAAALELHFPDEVDEAVGLPAEPNLTVIESVTTGAKMAGEDHAVVIAGLTALITDMVFALSRTQKEGYPVDAREVLNRFQSSAAYRAHFNAAS